MGDIFNFWDIILVAGVSLMGTAVAYLRHPEHKAFVMMLPVPFTLATLALGRPLDATNVFAMGLLFGFTIGVWVLHSRMGWPILIAISVCALAYCVFGFALNRFLPSHGMAFWSAALIVMAGAMLLIRVLPYQAEPYHRTPLPVWVKLPAIALIIVGLVAIKHQLGGFMTMFPMVGVIAAYEARYSLWTMVRRIPWIVLIMTPVMAVIRLTQERIGLPGALGLAWLLLPALLWTLRHRYSSVRAAPVSITPSDLFQNRDAEKCRGCSR